MSVEKLMKRCQTGVGGRNAINDAHDIMAECYGKLGWMQQRIKTLELWLEGDATCPCCEQSKQCLDDCTFQQDAPTAADHMYEVRKLLHVES